MKLRIQIEVIKLHHNVIYEGSNQAIRRVKWECVSNPRTSEFVGWDVIFDM
jgi:hypothetical protein